MEKVLYQLGTLGICLIASLYLIKEVGIFAWISKYLHSKLPREKSMAIWALKQKKTWRTGFAIVTYRSLHEIKRIEGQVEIVDHYTMVRYQKQDRAYTRAISNFQVIEINFKEEKYEKSK